VKKSKKPTPHDPAFLAVFRVRQKDGGTPVFFGSKTPKIRSKVTLGGHFSGFQPNFLRITVLDWRPVFPSKQSKTTKIRKTTKTPKSDQNTKNGQNSQKPEKRPKPGFPVKTVKSRFWPIWTQSGQNRSKNPLLAVFSCFVILTKNAKKKHGIISSFFGF
jgi:hypothetical protein